MWFVYILICDQEIFYVGTTSSIVKRYKQHQKKVSFFTKKFSELKLIYCEEYKSKTEAIKREKQLKGWSKAKKQLLLDGKLGINTCTKLVEALLADENLL